MELKIEDVKIGTKLELVEEELQKATKPFVLGWLDYMRSQEEIIVTGLDGDMLEVNHSDDWGISEDSIGYFKKKEQSQQYTFDDLIDVARKAFNDGVIRYYGRSVSAVFIEIDGNDKRVFNKYAIREGAEFIQSLYKETFVIECEEDIKLIRSYPLNKEPSFDSDKSPKATLSNGNVIHVFRKDEDADNVCVYMRNSLYKNYLDFEVLKGATVTQSK